MEITVHVNGRGQHFLSTYNVPRGGERAFGASVTFDVSEGTDPRVMIEELGWERTNEISNPLPQFQV